MTLPAKLVIGGLTLSSATAISCGAVIYSKQGTEINKLIEQEYEYLLLDTSEASGNKDESHWTTNWKAYVAENTNKDKDLLNLDGWNKSSPGDSSLPLKKKCKNLSTKTVSNNTDPLYGNVTKYCGRIVTVEDEAKKNNLRILKTEASSSDESTWATRHSKAKELKGDLTKLGIIQSNPTAENIRTGCGKAAKEKNKKIDNYKEIYRAYVTICTAS